MKRPTDRTLFIGTGIVIGAAYLALFVQSVSLGVLHTDAAKLALNLTFPHPPLGRLLSLFSQLIFGPGVFAARLPTLMAGLLGIMLFLLILYRRKERDAWKLLPFTLVVLSTGGIAWLDMGYQTSYLFLAIAVMAYGYAMESALRRHALIVVGYVFAIWMQLQGVLLFPAVALTYLFAVRKGECRIRLKDPVTLLYGFAVLHSALVGLWFLSNPFALADAWRLAQTFSEGNQFWRLGAFVASDFFGLFVFTCIVTVFLFIQQMHRTASAVHMDARIPLALCVACISFYLIRMPNSYYSPLLTACALWAISEIELPDRVKRVSVTLLAVAVFAASLFASGWGARLEGIHPTGSDLRALREQAALCNVCMGAGVFGYDWNYLVQRRLVRSPGWQVFRDSVDAMFVFYPDGLTEDEREMLEDYHLRISIGGVDVYAP